jgi:arylsulfatase A
MKPIKLIFLFLIITSASQAQSKKKKGNSKNTESKPNIIFILADDLGIGNVSCYGADNYQTPNIDKLAKEGIQFNHAYTVPLCGPSRALILTGRYPFRTGAVNQDMTAQMKPEAETMIPKILKSAGYVSTSSGKWGQLPLSPAEFGFDDYIRFKGSGLYKSNSDKLERYNKNGVDMALQTDEYFPDVIQNHLIDFIVANKNNPFYAYYPMSHVHGTIVATPDSKPDSKDLFADNILYMDKLVGQLVNTLDSLHLRENTLLIFFGDNGTSSPYSNHSPVNGKKLSGKKGEMKECGSLVPMIANWPGKIAPGSKSDLLIDGSDFLPTFAELAGAELPKQNTFDGQSFLPQLLGKKGNDRDWIFMELGNKWYVRNDKWKLNREGELFDMSNSPFEEILVTAEKATPKAEAARQELQAVLDKLAPQNGILDNGDGSGRHANKEKNKQKKSAEKTEKE